MCYPINKTSFRIAGSRLKEYDSREKVLSRFASEAVTASGLGASLSLPLVADDASALELLPDGWVAPSATEGETAVDAVVKWTAPGAEQWSLFEGPDAGIKAEVLVVPLASDDAVDDVTAAPPLPRVLDTTFDLSSTELVVVSGARIDAEIVAAVVGVLAAATKSENEPVSIFAWSDIDSEALTLEDIVEDLRAATSSCARISSKELIAVSVVWVDAEIVAAVVDVLAVATRFGPNTSSHLIEFSPGGTAAVRCRRFANSSGSLSTRQNLSDWSKALTNLSTCSM